VAVRSLVSGLAAALVAALAVALTPAAAHAETTLCSGSSFSQTAACDPAWAVNMTFMHWRMYSGHNCTNYVAWRLSVDGVPQPAYLLGNARDWASRAKSHGVPVTTTPAVGAVGSWPGRNHVVYIDEVRADSLLITEDSFSAKRYRKYLAYPGERNYPAQFIHFRGAPGQATITGATPMVSGKAAVGEALTATAGNWNPAGVTLAYQWLRDGSIIGGATGSRYLLTTADVGRRISVAITGSKAGLLPRTARSQPTAPVTAGSISAGQPTISGAAVEGTTLRVNVGQWSPTGLAFTYKWYAGTAKISTSRKVKLTKQHRGKAITVRVTGAARGFASVAAVSAATPPVARKGSPPSATPPQAKPIGTVIAGTPTIAGTGRMMVGDALTTSVGNWAPAPVTTTIQWMRDGAPIPGATGASYTLTEADLGRSLRVDVIGTKANYSSARASSAATPAVTARQLTNTVAPTLSGDPIIAGVLTASPGVWSPSGAATAIQWTRNGTAIAGATGSTYSPTQADHRQTIGAVVTATIASLPPAVRTLTASAPVRAVPVVRVDAADPQEKKARVTIRVNGLGTPVAGPVTITEGAAQVGTVQVPGGPVEYVFRSTPGRHALHFTFGGADGFASASADLVVKIK
jgi:surface antigen